MRPRPAAGSGRQSPPTAPRFRRAPTSTILIIRWPIPRPIGSRTRKLSRCTASSAGRFAADGSCPPQFRAGQGCPAPDPIFILGLPRAGSTLLEQILASHSQIDEIDGTLELPDILALAQRAASSEQVRRPLNTSGVAQWKPFEPWLGPLKAALGRLILPPRKEEKFRDKSEG